MVACLIAAVFFAAQAAPVAAAAVDFQGLVLAINSTAKSLNVNGKIVNTSGATQYKSDLPGPAGFDQIKYGMNLRIQGNDQTGGSVLADRIDIKEPGSGNGGGGSLRFPGLIDAIDYNAKTLKVNGMLITTTNYTAVENLLRAPMPFSSLRVGDIVKVGGTPVLNRSSILAGEIELEDDISGGNIVFNLKFKGTLQSKNAATRTMMIGGRTVNTTALTKYEDANENPLTFDQMAVGQYVEVKANTQPSGPPIAVKIEYQTPGIGGVETEFLGRINSVNATAQTMNIGGYTVRVSTTTALLDHFRVATTFAKFTIGEYAEVAGTRQTDGTIQATRIKVEDRGPGWMLVSTTVHLRSTIQSLSLRTSRMTVMGNVIVIREGTTVLLDQQNQPARLWTYANGQIVEVEGLPQPNGEILALKVKREDKPLPTGNNTVVDGAVFSVNPATNTLVVGGITLHRGGTTVFEDRFGRDMKIEDISVGDYVTVYGEPEKVGKPSLEIGGAMLQALGTQAASRVVRVDQFFAPAAPHRNAISRNAWSAYD